MQSDQCNRSVEFLSTIVSLHNHSTCGEGKFDGEEHQKGATVLRYFRHFFVQNPKCDSMRGGTVAAVCCTRSSQLLKLSIIGVVATSLVNLELLRC